MTSPTVLLVHGTWGTHYRWWQAHSPFADILTRAGARLFDESDPYFWDGDLDGVSDDNSHWEAASAALRWFLRAYAPTPPHVIAHSHGGQIIALAARHGACFGRVVTVGTPRRLDLEAEYIALRDHSEHWTHIYSDEYRGRWQVLGTIGIPTFAQLCRSRTMRTRSIPAAHVNVYEPARTHSDLLDPALWLARGWVRFVTPWDQ